MEFVIVLGILFLMGISIIHSSKVKDEFTTMINGDERLSGAEIIKTAMDTYIAISQKGYIAIKYIPSFEESIKNPSSDIVILDIKDINGFEIKKNSQSSANIGNALAGGLLFGGAGAIVGGLGFSKEKINKLSILFRINNFNKPTIELKMLDSTTSVEESISKIDIIFSLLEILEKQQKIISTKKQIEGSKESH